MRTLAQALASLGYPVLRIDPIGVGDSLDLGVADKAWDLWREAPRRPVTFSKRTLASTR